jgi:plastocyanin
MHIRVVLSALTLTLIVTLSNVAPAATTNIVQMGNFTFTPRVLTITNSDTVTWVNTSGLNHDTTSSNGVWASQPFHSPTTFSFKFNNNGSFPYYCVSHRFNNQNGTINVVAAPNARPTVTITNPANNTVFTAPATFKIEARATDTDGTISQVQFTGPGGSSITDTITPFSATATDVPTGNYTITAVATDNSGGKETNSIAVIVKNPPTPVVLAMPAIGSTNITLSFLSESGRTYTVEFKPQLDSAQWQTLSNFVANGTNATVSDTNTNAQRFYRVGAQ